MDIRELPSIDAVLPAAWNALAGADSPFLRHEFLAALENTGCVGGDTGWTPAHLAAFESGRLVAAAPLYRKTHSWGEFVFDFAWAQAYVRHGLPYYPKLLCAVPFSPINAPRLLMQRESATDHTRQRLVAALEHICGTAGLSSAHALFIAPEEVPAFASRGWLTRTDVQFHWHNRGYHDFDHYLDAFRSEKRKQMRRERRRCAESGIRFVTRHGGDITPDELRFAFAMHARTFHLHGHEPYLTLAFFEEIAPRLGHDLMVKIALHGDTPVAAAIFLASADTLYGRYWGSIGDFHSLHFETCYHQGIEYCIERGLARFEPGTQGEHKIVRGFEASTTHSAHFIADPRFRHAIADFLRREEESVADYSAAVAAHAPFRRT